MNIDVFAELVGAIYEAASNQSRWPWVANRLSAALYAEYCVLNVRDGAAGAGHVVAAPETRLQAELAAPLLQMLTEKSWTQFAAARPNGVAYFDDRSHFDHVSPSAAGNNSVYAVASLPRSGGQFALGVINIDERELSEDAAKRQLDLLVPHLRRALDGCAVERHGTTPKRFDWVAGFDALGLGAVIVDEKLNALYSNQFALAAIGTDKGLSLCGGRFRAPDPVENEQLRLAIRSAIQEAANGRCAGTGSFRFVRLGSRLVLAIHPVHEPASDSSRRHPPVAMVLIGVPGEALSSVREMFSPMHSLTPSEGRLVAALAKGERLNAYARRNRISTNTVKTQLKSVFQKTGHARQSELICDVVSYSLIAAEYQREQDYDGRSDEDVD